MLCKGFYEEDVHEIMLWEIMLWKIILGEGLLYHYIIEKVECRSGGVAKKWSSASRVCKYAGAHSLISDKTNFLYILKICPMILLHLLT